MSAIKLHVIKPSVNNMTARVFVRAAKLDFTEDDVYGKTRTDDFLAKNPAHLTPMMEAPACRRAWCGRAARSCSISATSIISTSSIRPSRKSGRWSTARCSISSARSIPISSRATYGALNFPHYAGEVGASDADAAGEGQGAEGGARRDGRDARGVPQILSLGQDLHRRRPSFDRRHPPGLRASNSSTPSTTRPGLAATYWSAVKNALGDAYAEPAKDVEGYIAYVKGLKK